KSAVGGSARLQLEHSFHWLVLQQSLKGSNGCGLGVVGRKRRFINARFEIGFAARAGIEHSRFGSKSVIEGLLHWRSDQLRNYRGGQCRWGGAGRNAGETGIGRHQGNESRKHRWSGRALRDSQEKNPPRFRRPRAGESDT